MKFIEFQMVRFNRFGKAASQNRLAYHEYQNRIGNYFLQQFVKPYAKGKKIVDIGCGEGGVLVPFAKAGYDCIGLEYSPDRVEYARQKSSPNIRFIEGDIEQFNYDEKFDIILMLDVIEHLQQKLTALRNIKKILSAEGIVIISFPPFRSPFGGHQQVMKSFLKYIPYIHLLPETIYSWLLEKIESKGIESHLKNYQNGITIRQFEKLIDQAGFEVMARNAYLIRPRQALRFGLKIIQNRVKIFNEYLTTGIVYILKASSD